MIVQREFLNKGTKSPAKSMLRSSGGTELSWTAGGGGSELYELDDGGGGPCRLGDETKECELDGRGAR